MVANRSEDFRKRLIRHLMWSLLAAVAIYGGSMIVSDINAVGASFAKLGFVGWAIILSLSLVNYGLRFLRWEIYLGRVSKRIPTFLSMAYYVGGFAFTTTPGKAGETVRSLYLKRHGVAYVHSLSAFFAERSVDLIAMLLLALLAALTFQEFQWPVLVITVFVTAVLLLVHAKSFHAFVDRQRLRLPSAKLQSMISRSLDLLRSTSVLLKSGTLYVGLVLALIAWGAEGVAFHIILDTLGVDTSVRLAVGIYSISILAGAVSFIPGGLGSTEAIMVVLVRLTGADLSTAVAATLICRIATLWFAVIIGGIALAAAEIYSKVSPECPR